MWRLKDPETYTHFQEIIKDHMLSLESEAGSTAEEVRAKTQDRSTEDNWGAVWHYTSSLIAT